VASPYTYKLAKTVLGNLQENMVTPSEHEEKMGTAVERNLSHQTSY
jgi:hypothetical protein